MGRNRSGGGSVAVGLSSLSLPTLLGMSVPVVCGGGVPHRMLKLIEVTYYLVAFLSHLLRCERPVFRQSVLNKLTSP